jgi:hypothetical protein
VAATDRVMMGIRLAPDQMKRLESLASRRKQTKQAFVEGAVFAEMTAEEQRRGRLLPHELQGPASAVQPAFGINDDSTPRETGGGFDLAWLKSSPPRKFPEQESEQQQQKSQVVVNVGNGGNDSAGKLDMLVNFVVSAKSEFEQQNRMRMVASILQDTATSEEEKRSLAAKVDELVAAKKKQLPQNDTSVFRSASLVYDKLRDLLK